MQYSIPDLALGELHSHTIEVEKSRFITWVGFIPSNEAFDSLLSQARSTYKDASHHCSAFIAGAPDEQIAIGFSDDGEPGGTAGRPMFQALEGSGIGQVGVVVTRYFGGTKLGTGGLVRAYTQAVIKALETVPTTTFTQRRPVVVQVDFAAEATTRHWLSQHNINVDDAQYDAKGVILYLGWPLDDRTSTQALSQHLKAEITLLES